MDATAPSQPPQASGLPVDENGYCYRDHVHFDGVLGTIARKLAWTHRPAMVQMIVLPAAMWGMILALFFAFREVHFAVYIWYLLFAAAVSVHATSSRRFVAKIIKHRMCLGCGYELSHTPTDSGGWAACSECGRRFNVAEYRRPPHGYQRVRWQPRPAKPGYPAMDTGLDWLHPDDEARLEAAALARRINRPLTDSDSR